jgi:phage terminase large subunit
MTTKMSTPTISDIIGKGYSQFWDDKHFYRVVKGGRGSKKSKTTALNLVSRLMQFPWANILVIRRYSNTNRQSTYTDICWAINKLHASELFTVNMSMPEITYKPTGQKILFRGLDDPLKITSIAVPVGVLSWLWLEEAYEVETREKFETVVESIRGSNDSPDFFKQITVTFNPWSENHWLKSMFFDRKTRVRDLFAQTTTYRCNEWLDDQDRSRYEDLYRTNPRRAKIVCEGDWGIAEGLVYNNVVVEDFDVSEMQRKYHNVAHGMDFGLTNDPTALVNAVIDTEGKNIYIYDEMYEYGMTNEQLLKWLREHHFQNTKIIADNAEVRLIQWLRAKGIRKIERCVKGKESIMMGITFLQDYKIHVKPNCKNTIAEFNSYSYARDKEGNWLNKPVDANNHAMDALRYAFERYIMPKRVANSSITDQVEFLNNMGV